MSGTQSTSAVTFDDLSVGQLVISAERGPFSRGDLARFCTTTTDFNPIHLDDEFARNAGFPRALVNGPLVLGFIGLHVARWAGIERVLSFSGRLIAPTFVNDSISCEGHVRELREVDDGVVAEIEMTAAVGDRQVATATAIVRR